MHGVTTAYVWESGKRSGVNQDSLSLQQVRLGNSRIVFAVLCDGIGGLAEGETASGYVAEELTEWFYQRVLPEGKKLLRFFGRRLAPLAARRAFVHGISRRIYRIREGLQDYGKQEGIRLGTTAAICLLWDGFYLWAQIGDSRIYRAGRSARIDKIHTADRTSRTGKSPRTGGIPRTSKIPRTGGISRADKTSRTGKSPRTGGIPKVGKIYKTCRMHKTDRRIKRLTKDDWAAGRLTRCIGTGNWHKPAAGCGYLRKGGLLLLCSDGFYRRLPREKMREMLGAGMREKDDHRLERRLEQTAERLMERGEYDNISAICMLRG